MQRILAFLESGRAYCVEYTPSRGKNAGREISDIFINGRKMLPAKDYAVVGEDGEIYRTTDMDNLWTDEEIGVTGIAREGGAEFKRGKKPERLLKRVIELSTSPGDWVLDSFLGSGTTAAVAHKLGRKWIGIELLEHAETLCLPRLKRVVSGEDQSGISKEVGWAGGGGFAYCTLGESVVGKDAATGVWVLNYTNGPLIEAICLREGFMIIADGDLHGRKGHHYAHVADHHVTNEYVNSLLAHLEDHERLTVYCQSHDPYLQGNDRVEIKRIPQALVQGHRR